MACYSPLKGFKPLEGPVVFKRPSSYAEKIDLACNQCLGCRIDRTCMWAARIIHESAMHRENSFITLTYRDPGQCNEAERRNGHHLPSDGSLHKSHVQKFLKRLRKSHNHPIRYIYCGEYGELGRPHYHAILFGKSFKDQALWQDNDGYNTYYSPELKRLWPYGFSTIGEVNYETAAYVAGYVFKKVLGKNAEDHYLRFDDYGNPYWLEPEYINMSLKPGLGEEWFKKYQSDVYPHDEVPVPGKGTMKKVPKYYDLLLERKDPELLAEVKNLRETYRKQHPDKYDSKQLVNEYKVAKANRAIFNRRDKVG